MKAGEDGGRDGAPNDKAPTGGFPTGEALIGKGGEGA